MPAGVTPDSRTSRFHHEERVPVGVRKVVAPNDGRPTGAIETRPRVEKDWCTWQGERWVAGREAEAVGTDRAPKWPDPALRDDEREAGRREAFRGSFRDAKGQAQGLDLTEEVWAHLAAGQSYKVERAADGTLAGVAE